MKFKIGDSVEIVGGFDFMKGEVCKVIEVLNCKTHLFPIRVKSKIMEYAIFTESDLKLIEESK